MKKVKGNLKITILLISFIILLFVLGSVYVTKKIIEKKENEKITEIGELKKIIAKMEFEKIMKQCELNFESGHQATIPIDEITIPRGKTKNFVLGISNISNNKNFRIAIVYKQAYDTFGNVMIGPDNTYMQDNWVFGTLDIKREVDFNSYEYISIPIKVAGRMNNADLTEVGKYEFNVCVCECNKSDGCFDDNPSYCMDKCTSCTFSYTNKCMEFFYGGYMLSMYVEVP